MFYKSTGRISKYVIQSKVLPQNFVLSKFLLIKSIFQKFPFKFAIRQPHNTLFFNIFYDKYLFRTIRSMIHLKSITAL